MWVSFSFPYRYGALSLWPFRRPELCYNPILYILYRHAISKILMGRIISKKLYQYGMRNKSHLDLKLFHNKLSSPLYFIYFLLFFVSSPLIRMSVPSTHMHVVFFANTLNISLLELVHKEYEIIVFQK